MKVKFLILSLSLSLLTIVLLNSYKIDIATILNVNERFVKIEDNLYVDKYEVNLRDYKLFLLNKKQKNEDYLNLIYDSTKWTSGTVNYPNLQDFYFNHNAYNNYPIVSVSYESALEFCNWLTAKYNSNNKKKYKKVIFRLPTEEEFIKVASSGFDIKKIFYPWGSNHLIDSKNQKLCNFRRLNQEDINYNGRVFNYNNIINSFDNNLEIVNSYTPNKYGVFNIVGNVSEMIQEKNYAMGGDFISTGYNVRITSKKEFKDKDISVGFRVYMEIIEL